ncbi:hypothetical protein JOE57_000969 [Microlunatus panaciterrae]|uniref:Mce-associated membrane protein n=1 Tax=Microlunatus panaciterrae TaxID=400768 RepID=A0ABS2RHA1_9ACTN|nr:hypothetical protein [Microlunatus panaciterrae]MBM7798048.1 hypothetical protein [Microlunatus panaciterrae]
MAYWKALDSMYQAGGADRPTAAMKETMTGEALALMSRIAKDTQAEKVRQSGTTKITATTVVVVNISNSPRVVSLESCVDRTQVRVRRNGSVITTTPKFLSEQPELHFVAGRWKVAAITSQAPKKC